MPTADRDTPAPFQQLTREDAEPVSTVLKWPTVPDLSGGTDFTDAENEFRTGVLVGGINTFNFNTGIVTIPQVNREETMTASLGDTDSSVVRSVRIAADQPYFWETDTGLRGYQRDTLEIALSDIQITQLEIKTQIPAAAVVTASTRPNPPVEPTGPERFRTRISYSEADNDTQFTVGTTYELLAFTPVAETFKDNPQSGNEIWVGNVQTVGVLLDSDVTDRPTHFSARADPIPEAGNLPTVDIPGWRADSPKVVTRNSQRLHVIDVSPYDNLEFRARNGGSTGSSFFEMAVFGFTE